MRAGVCAIALLTLPLGAGCAHKPANQVEIDQLNRSIESLRVQNTAYAKQVEELENRLFILNDQLESQKVNQERVATPRLPNILLGPAASMREACAPPFSTTPFRPVWIWASSTPA